LDRREVLILNLDTFAAKNVSQIRLMEAEGYGFTVVTNDSRRASRRVFDEQGFRRSRLIVLGGLQSKVVTVFSMLLRHRFHHVEFYPAGRLALLYLLLIKLFGHRLVVIERGDIGSLHLYDALTRLSLRLAYRFADRVVYKETYMKEPLDSFTRAPLAFVPNCIVPPSSPLAPWAARTIDFLWVNRLTVQRRPEWFLRALQDPALGGRRAAMLGFEEGSGLPERQRALQDQLRSLARAEVETLGFVEPGPFYDRARFFCLPSEIIFGNNSLLEAMARGVVPVVTESPGIERVVCDGVNGIVTAFDEPEYKKGLLRAAAMDQEAWAKLSRAARDTVEQEFSGDAWRRRMAKLYDEIGAA
jgi:glycosyltransferase involved in cell wall biosynthesis